MIQPIRNQGQYERALDMINYFMGKNRTQSETDLMEVMSILVAHYEDQHYKTIIRSLYEELQKNPTSAPERGAERESERGDQ